MQAIRITLAGCLAFGCGLSWGQDAAAIIQQCGLKAGVISHLGASDGKLEADLVVAGNFVVHGLALDNAARDSARALLLRSGAYGLASVEKSADLSRLPYSDNFVSVLVADLDALGNKAPGDSELNRVVAPLGFTYLKKGGSWKATLKPLPAGMDGWTHYYGDVDAKDANKDIYAIPPNSVKWITGNHHLIFPGDENKSPTKPNTDGGFRIENGIIFYNINDASQGAIGEMAWRGRNLIARNAFSGVPLWRSFPAGDSTPGTMRFATVLKDGKAYTNLQGGDYTAQIDVLTGKVLRIYTKGRKTAYFAKHGDPLDVTEETIQNVVYGGRLYQVADTIVVLDPGTGDVIQRYAETDNRFFQPVIVPEENALYTVVYHYANHPTNWRFPSVGGVQAIQKFSLPDMKPGLRIPYDKTVCRMTWHKGKLVVWGSMRGDASGGTGDTTTKQGFLTVFDATTGAQLWQKDGNTDKTYSGIAMNMLVFKDLVWIEGHPFDLNTGTQVMAQDFGQEYNWRCVPPRASNDWMAAGFVEYIDGNHFDAKGKNARISQYATRSNCAGPALPAHGQWFFSPGGCQCLQGVLRGFSALYHQGEVPTVPDGKRLEGAPDYGAGTVKVAGLKPLWIPNAVMEDTRRTNFDYNRDSLSAATAANGYAYVSISREHRVEARQNGGVVWSFVAGGRISQAPLVIGDKVYFGSHDGYVYCVDGADGHLVWRYLAAPGRKLMYAYGELESAWPVFGVVQVGQSVVYSAGRQAELDGGMVVGALDPNTGATSWRVPVSINNIRLPGANTSRSCMNTVPAWDGSKVVVDAVSIDPANPKAYVMGTPISGITVALRGNPHRPRAVDPSLPPLQVKAEAGEWRVLAPLAGPQHLELFDSRGRRLWENTGMGPNLYRIPQALGFKGNGLLKVETAGRPQSAMLSR